MNLREVSIGRANDCDIYLDPRCQYASGRHATIYYDGSQLMFRDMSTNGTFINNVSVKNRAVPISRGDMIMLAGKYPLNWAQIDRFFPPTQLRQTRVNTSFGGEVLPSSQVVTPAVVPTENVEAEISKWNWGAFMLYPIWGFFNGCWWAIFIWLFFGVTLAPNIVFGIYGNRWAWQNKSWSSLQAFKEIQSSWATWGIVLFCVSVFLSLLVVVLYAALIAAAISNF